MKRASGIPVVLHHVRLLGFAVLVSLAVAPDSPTQTKSQYEAEVLWVNDPKISFQFVFLASSGAVTAAAPQGTVTGWPAFFDAADREYAAQVLDHGKILHVASPRFLGIDDDGLDSDFLRIGLALREKSGGSRLFGFTIRFLPLAAPEVASLGYRELLARALFGRPYADLERMAQDGRVPMKPLTEHRQRAPFARSDIEELLSLEVPQELLVTGVGRAGVSFRPSASELEHFRGLGASQALLEAVEKAAARRADPLFWQVVPEDADERMLQLCLKRFPEVELGNAARQRLEGLRRSRTSLLIVYNQERRGGKVAVYLDGRPVVLIGPMCYARIRMEPGARRLQIGSVKDRGTEVSFSGGQVIQVAIDGRRVLSSEQVAEEKPLSGFKPIAGEDVLAADMVLR